MKTSMVAAGLAFGAATLAGCSQTLNCSATYRGGCAPGPASPAITRPVPAPNNVPTPNTVSTPNTVPLGDPAEFANVDDKQCRSYGLTFGSRDYADCRIRLSAQHRGLDPNLGTNTADPASR